MSGHFRCLYSDVCFPHRPQCTVVDIKVFSNRGKKPSHQSPLQNHNGKNKSVFKSGNKTFTSKPTAVQYHNGRNQNVFKCSIEQQKLHCQRRKCCQMKGFETILKSNLELGGEECFNCFNFQS